MERSASAPWPISRRLGAAGAAGLADAERREVVMQDEALARLAARVGVEVLRFLARGERREAERLRFAALEESAAVGAGQQADLCRELARMSK